ncbi:hypothetical protein AURDEDRAFT_174854 [Auricularia subglabra TFB-10046 SS5]|nr:hypothetical protein AURDEDRAFT_174854 [Auricularia subglabra TFB-10046 SS5]
MHGSAAPLKISFRVLRLDESCSHCARRTVHHGLGNGTALFKSGFEGTIPSHAYFSQHFNGIPVTNVMANVALNKAGKFTSFASSFLSAPSKIASPTPALTAAQAAAKAVSALGGAALPKARIVLNPERLQVQRAY